jgi:hypothetical protein
MWTDDLLAGGGFHPSSDDFRDSLFAALHALGTLETTEKYG